MDKSKFWNARTRNCIKCGGAHFHRQGNLHKEEQGRSGGTPFSGGKGGVHPPYIRRVGCLHRTGHARRTVLRSTDSGLRTGHAGLALTTFNLIYYKVY